MTAVIRRANGEDFDRILEFVKNTETSSDHVHNHPENYFVMENAEQQLVATAGIKFEASEGIVRTLVMDSKRCNTDDVIRFISSLLTYAEKKRLHFLYILTMSPALFTAFGFEEMSEDEVPENLIGEEMLERSSRVGATVMMKSFVNTHSLKQ